MKERNWKALCDELKELIGDRTNKTAVDVIVWNNSSLELVPAKENVGSCFYHLECVVDFCRCKKLSCYVCTDYTPEKKLICRIH